MAAKSGAVARIEAKMETIDPVSFRYHVLDTCRQFKISWLDLGRALYSVYHDKKFREWGFMTFENYCAKELGIRKNTGLKLLKSYAFLEKEEPQFVQKVSAEGAKEDKYPDLEAINLLRVAKSSKRLDEEDYQTIRRKVLEDARDAADVRDELKRKMRPLPAPDGDGPRSDPRHLFIRRVSKALEMIRREAQGQKFLRPSVIKLIQKLEEALGEEIE